MIVGGGYSLWVFNRIAYGNLKTQYLSKFTKIQIDFEQIFNLRKINNIFNINISRTC